MKKVSQILGITLFALFTLVACNKEESDAPTDNEALTTGEDLAMLQNLDQDTEEEIDYQLTTRGNGPDGDCPTVTVTPDDGSFPRTVTIDYGDGCEGPNGHVRKGQIVVDLTDEWMNPGATRTVQLIDFFVDDVQVLGDRVLVNEGLNGDGNPYFTRTVTGAGLIFPDGQESSWEAQHTLTYIEGAFSDELFDDVFQIEGASAGVNRNGVPFTGLIVEPLVKPRNCRWIVTGVKEITANDLTRTLDYGNGQCNPIATLTLPNGVSFDVLIRRWW